MHLYKQVLNKLAHSCKMKLMLKLHSSIKVFTFTMYLRSRKTLHVLVSMLQIKKSFDKNGMYINIHEHQAWQKSQNLEKTDLLWL